MKRQHTVFLLGAVLLTALTCSTAYGELKVGNLRIYPEIGIEEMYRSNIYQVQSGAKSDWITTILPGLRLRYLFGGMHSLDLGYSGAWKNYTRYSANNYWDQRLWGNLGFRFPGGLNLGLEHKYINSWLERSPFIPYQRHFAENITGVLAAQRFADRWKVQARYLRDDYSYFSSRDRASSSLTNLYAGSVYYRFTARTSGFVEYQYIPKTFDTRNTFDSKSNLAFLGISFDPSGKLKGEFKAGYGQKEYDKNVVGRDNKLNTWQMYADLTEDFTKYTSVRLNALRSFKDDGDFGNASYYYTNVTLLFQHYLTEKIGGNTQVAYTNSDYQDDLAEPVTGVMKRRKDTAWSMGVGAFYNIQEYLKVRLDYNYITRDSNFYGYSYNESTVGFKVVYSP